MLCADVGGGYRWLVMGVSGGDDSSGCRWLVLGVMVVVMGVVTNVGGCE